VTARDLAAWAADAFASYDLATTHRIATEVTGAGPLPDYVSARVDPVSGVVVVPRPVGVVTAPRATGEVVRLALLTRNALLVTDAAAADRVRDLAALAEKAGAPAGVLQLADLTGSGPEPEAPEIVLVAAGLDLPGISFTGPGHAVRAARAALRETGSDRIRVHASDPGVALHIAAALPVARVAIGDGEMPPPSPDGMLTWVRVGLDRLPDDQPSASPGGPVPAYPRASNEAP